MRFKLLAGVHQQRGKDIKTEDGKTVKTSETSETFKIGDVVESPHDLAAKHGQDKFQRLHDKPENDPPPPVHKRPDDATLNRMTLTQLQALAAEEEIDLKGAKTAAEALRIIKAS